MKIGKRLKEALYKIKRYSNGQYTCKKSSRQWKFKPWWGTATHSLERTLLRLTILHARKDTEQLEFPYTVDGIVNGYKHFGRKFVISLKAEHTLIM